MQLNIVNVIFVKDSNQFFARWKLVPKLKTTTYALTLDPLKP